MGKTPGLAAKRRAATRRRQQARDRGVYAAVDVRDGLRCRICGDYAGILAERHHLHYRSLGGQTITSNVVTLCPSCHEATHAKRIAVSGDADARNIDGALCGVKYERRMPDGSYLLEWYR